MQFLGLNKQKNPHFQRLMRSYARQSDEFTLRTITLDWVGFMILTNCICVACSLTGFDYGRPVLGLIIAIVLPTPIFLSIYAAWFTAHDASSTDYELVTLSTISNESLVWGYIAAPFEQFKVIRGFPIGLIPFFAVVTGCGFLTSSLMYQVAVTAETPQPDNMVSFMAASGSLILSYVGIYWLSIVMGVMIALALRKPFIAVFITMLVMMVFAPAWLWVAVLILDPFHIKLAQMTFNPLWFVIIGVPMVLVFMTLRLAYRFARDPLLQNI